MKVRHDYLRVENETVLAIATKAFNDTIDPKELCLILLVFGLAPEPRIRFSKLSNLKKSVRLRAAQLHVTNTSASSRKCLLSLRRV